MDTKINIMENLEWHQVAYDSNRIERIAHSGNDLYVEFKNNGAGYKYPNVSIEIFQRILNKECTSKSEGKASYGATLDVLVIKSGNKGERYK